MRSFFARFTHEYYIIKLQIKERGINMLVKIVGIENAEFEVDNQTIRGQKLFYEYEHQKVEGLGTGTVFEKKRNKRSWRRNRSEMV